MSKKKFYITTSIAYTNALPHLGFALEAVQADVIARYHCLLDEDVFFLTGTDEHGQKVVKAAEEAGKNPKNFTDEISQRFKELTKSLNISNDEFIRTTDQKKHWPTVRKAWLEMKKNGDIYKKNYKGLYCSGCEAFITKKDLVNGKCAVHQREPEIIEEENYFFRLSRYSKQIKKILEKDEIKIIPETRKNEMLSFAKQGLEDISFSRPRKDLKWGIPVPDDNSQTIYVWADALTNYLSGAPGRWPADIHFIGKDIQKFHCLIWPGMLLSLGLPLPRKIFVHGFINVQSQKMSKSLGNIVDPFELIEKYGVDSVRYFLLREIPPTEDGDFTREKFEGRYNADLSRGLGNLVARVMKMAQISNFQFPNSNKFSNSKFQTKINKTREECHRSLNELRFNEALAAAWELISFCDRYIEKEKPWQESKKQKEIIGNLLFALKEIAELLQPFLPESSDRIKKQIKTGRSSEPLFPRIPIDKVA